jgi:hypothetical protein
VLADNPVSVYEVDIDVPIREYVPEELLERYTKYPLAPETEFHDTLILLEDTAEAYTEEGADGADPLCPLLPEDVVA